MKLIEKLLYLNNPHGNDKTRQTIWESTYWNPRKAPTPPPCICLTPPSFLSYGRPSFILIGAASMALVTLIWLASKSEGKEEETLVREGVFRVVDKVSNPRPN